MNSSIIKSTVFHFIIILLFIIGYYSTQEPEIINPKKYIKINAVDSSIFPKTKAEQQKEDAKKTALQFKRQKAAELVLQKQLKNSEIVKERVRLEKIKDEQRAIKKEQARSIWLEKVAAKKAAEQQKIKQREIKQREIKQNEIKQKAIKKEQARLRWLEKVKKRKLAEKLAKQKVKKEQARLRWLEKVRKRREAEQRQKKLNEIELLQQQMNENNLNATPNVRSGFAPDKQNETDAVIERYSRLIRQKMGRYWQRPPNMRNLKIKAEVGILLNSDGTIRQLRITKPSAFSNYDISIQNALWATGTLPIPTDPKYATLFTEEELLMEFENF